MNDRLEGLRARWETLTERERRLVGALGVIATVLIVILPFYLLSSSIGALEDENEEIVAALREIDRADAMLTQREAEEAAAEARYRQRAPELGTFLEAESRERSMTIASVTSQPEVQEGAFRRRHVRAQLPATDLRNAIRLMAELEGAQYPIALERVYIDHFAQGDQYNVEVGVITYDRAPAAGADAPAGAARPGASGRAGPPSPP